jgi:hypothetical protein
MSTLRGTLHVMRTALFHDQGDFLGSNCLCSVDLCLEELQRIRREQAAELLKI